MTRNEGLKFKSALEDRTKEEIEALAKEGKEIYYRTGEIPRDSHQAFAVAALIRLEDESKRRRKPGTPTKRGFSRY